ncbi:hypothetical protein PAPYR_13205 [Paratrimastix pyriformis]|uniref:Uncharacterized protein n=1 Tax=Paratrimastix pyriformis TaxID=342808 RepID=A0ABQ8U2U2_9EUKA|nr:hypothetical protein PAPYR_13205 [Paratrimastix pyriformis]
MGATLARFQDSVSTLFAIAGGSAVIMEYKIAGNKAAASLRKAAKLESPLTGRKHARNFFRGSRFAAAAAPTGAAAHPAAAPFQRFRGPPRRPYVARAAAQGAPAAPAPTQRRHYAPKR